jgi:hypothetical protein
MAKREREKEGQSKILDNLLHFLPVEQRSIDRLSVVMDEKKL